MANKEQIEKQIKGSLMFEFRPRFFSTEPYLSCRGQFSDSVVEVREADCIEGKFNLLIPSN